MKSFLTYSGKGGVGKSTTTYCIYRAFKELGMNIMVLDMDLNTPSMHHLMSEDLISNHEYTGLFLDKSTINLFLRESVDEIRKRNPQILLIDTPPSITDIHLSLIKKLKISAAILVSQPSELSKADVERTVPFFEEKGITVLGIVENMVEDNGLEYRYKRLLSVPKSKGLDTKLVYEDNQEQFKSLSSGLLEMNLADVSQENKVKAIFDESITHEDVAKMYNLYYDEDDDRYDYYRLGRGGRLTPEDIKFVNLRSWKQVHQMIDDMKDNIGTYMGMGHLTDCVREATYEKVERLVKAFEYDDTALFMIVKNPNTSVTTSVAEIGTCTLKIDDKFNGIPTVEYQTDKGTIRMFPHEIMPVTPKILQDCILDGHTYVDGGKRMIPSVQCMLQYSYTFGATVGMPEIRDDELEEQFEERIEKMWREIGGK